MCLYLCRSYLRNSETCTICVGIEWMRQKYEAYIGIDPGRKGCCFLIYGKGYDYVDLKKDDLIIAKVLERWKENYNVIRCGLEKAQVYNHDNRKSCFGNGFHYGRIVTILNLLRIDFTEVSPQTWKRNFIPKTKEPVKERAFNFANQLFPTLKRVFLGKRRAPLYDRAEARLLAEYTKQVMR